ncbi:UTRA domain-containing protein [Marinobacter mangrovi]|uniref:UTRA domain-containing protein n=1 Tax=Marinobacter mangrovi TaxID=2803918 RepID=UPI001932AF5D|nr:UTRA domain-containing protein [Marinobacter mangrovi]
MADAAPTATRTPIYLKVRDYLADDIQSGNLPPHTRLPSERVLAESHDTTRVTARLALSQLEAEGKIYRSNRRGWFVSPARLVYNPTYDYSFTDYVSAQGREPRTETLGVDLTAVSSWLAARTGLAPGQSIVHLRRRRYIDGRPVLVENIYLDPARLPGIERFDFNRSLWKLLRERYGVELTQKQIQMYPTALVDPQAEALSVSAGTAGLYVNRLSRDGNGRFIEFDEEFWLHDTLCITVDVNAS